jgi:hypothetical protein
MDVSRQISPVYIKYTLPATFLDFLTGVVEGTCVQKYDCALTGKYGFTGN